jgi:hypothetical protein
MKMGRVMQTFQWDTFHCQIFVICLLVVALGAPIPARASPVPITNPSFEETGGVVLGDGGFTRDGSGLTGWTITGSGNVGLFKPAGIFFSSIPDGEHVAFSHGPEMSQVLSATLTVNTRYTLTVGVGDANNGPFGGYSIRLRAGGVTLTEDLNSLLPPDGEFLTSTVVFDALPGNPQLGLPLEIVLDSFSLETSFDWVSLDASPIDGSPALTEGLVGYWRFDGDLLDASGNANHGSGEGGVGFVADGRFGEAVRMDGFNDAVNVGHDASLNLSGPFTISLWARLDDAQLGGGNDLISLNQYFVSKGTGTFNSANNTFTFVLANSSPIIPDHVAFQIFDSAGTANLVGDETPLLQLTNLDPSIWYNFIGRWDGAEISIWLNGVKVDAMPFTGMMNTLPNANMLLGRLGNGTRFFDGDLDDVALWSRALSDAEIQAVSNGELHTCVQPPAGLISWWPGDGDANDIQDGNDGTLVNGATFAPGFVTSGSGQAFSFDGVDDYVSITHNDNLNVTSHTIEAWIRPPDFVPNPNDHLTILSKSTPRPLMRTFGLFIEHSGVPAPRTPGALLGAFTNGPNNSLLLSGNTVVTDGNLHHVAVTYDAPSGTMRLYLDGHLDAETMFAPGTLPDTHTLPASIGADLSDVGSNAQFFFDGLIDELELYNRALSASEIQAIFLAGSAGKCKPDADGDGVVDSMDACPATPAGTEVNAAGCPANQCLALTIEDGGADLSSSLVSWWDGDGDARDIQDGNDGTLQNGAMFAPGFVTSGTGQAFSFDGVDDYVLIANDPTLNPGLGSYTFDAWVKPEPTPNAPLPNAREIADKHGPGRAIWLIIVNPSGTVSASVRDNQLNFVGVTSQNSIPDGVFSHVAFVIDRSSNLLNLYVNGQEVASDSIATVGDISNTVPVTFGNAFINCPGCADVPTLGPFKGEIDEVEIYNRALSASEIQALFLAGSAGKCKGQPPPAPPTLDLVDASDTGVSNTDNVTNDTTLTFAGTAPPESTVELFADGGSLGTTAAAATGAWSLTTSLTEGIHSITATATDAAGNVSDPSAPLIVTIDTTDPTLTASLAPLPNVHGWNNTDVTVSFACTDTLSGVASTPPAPTIVSTEGSHTVTRSCEDVAGNRAQLMIAVNIDKTPPVILGLPIFGCTLWPPNHELVLVAMVVRSDGLSGIATESLTAVSNEPEDGRGDGHTAPDIVIKDGRVKVRAERSGSGDGRIYTITASATDLAGNVTTATATCEVPHDRGKGKGEKESEQKKHKRK